MLDAALIKECADTSLTPAIVEQFVAAAGSTDPLAVTVKSGGRLILVPKVNSPDDAMAVVRRYAGQAAVRVGLTQFPAGVGTSDASELKRDLVEPCANLRMGTAMFAKILRIVTKWYGNPKSEEVFPQIFDDAVYAWKTGEFGGESVFQAEDPGKVVTIDRALPAGDGEVSSDAPPADTDTENDDEEQNLGSADMRIDLSRIGGK